MCTVDKVDELPFFCLRRITPKEADFCLYSGQLFKSDYWSLSTSLALGVNCSWKCVILYKSKETDTGIMSVTMETEQWARMGKMYISKLKDMYTYCYKWHIMWYYQEESQDSLLKVMKVDKIFSEKIVLPWQQHLSRYLEKRSSYLNKIFTDLHHLSKATCYQRINKVQNFRSFHVIIDKCLMLTVSFS